MVHTLKSRTGLDEEGEPVPRLSTAEQIIAQALDNFNSDDFCDASFLTVAAQRVISDLEFHNFKIIKLAPKTEA